MVANIPKTWLSLVFLAVLNSGAVFSQEIITADQYMRTVSETYAQINDYEAGITIRSGNNEMIGNASYRSPSFMRIDFTRPAEQVIVFNGELLTVYLPEFRAVLSQSINPSRRSSSTTGASLASAQGLNLLRQNYVPSFVTDPNPEPLEANSRERVVKIRLTRRSIAEGFREIILSVNPDTKLIRRIEGRTISESEIRFDFTNIKTNVGIPEQRFIYDPPATANMYNNFLLKESE